jgi:hypothetical protein
MACEVRLARRASHGEDRKSPQDSRVRTRNEMHLRSVLFGERSLRRALSEYVEHYHAERNHQGKANVLLFPRNRSVDRKQPVQCRERSGRLLRYHHQEAA